MCKLMLSIPVTSVQNRLKTKLRKRLGKDPVNVLMKLNMGPPIELFGFPTAVYDTGRPQNRGVCSFCTDLAKYEFQDQQGRPVSQKARKTV